MLSEVLYTDGTHPECLLVWIQVGTKLPKLLVNTQESMAPFPNYWLIPRNQWLHPDITETLMSGTFDRLMSSHYKIKPMR